VIETVQLRQPIAMLENLAAVEQGIAAAAHIALFLDFDGTISSIVPVPSGATLDPEIRQMLTSLGARPDFHVAIVSGRALADVRDRVGLGHVIYVGNHGLEIEVDSTRFREPHAEALLRELRCLSLQLKLALSDTDGLEVEDKGLTLSVHFRRVNEHLHDWVRSVTFSTVSRWNSFTCREGKMVLEIKPQVDWHKGHAIKWILQGILPYASLPICIGDDVSDEDAFAAISDGITIKVGGSGDTRAQYLLPDVHAVGEFLQWLDHAKPHASFAYSERAGR
jgi:trehalose 6-phosphate phosphatase